MDIGTSYLSVQCIIATVSKFTGIECHSNGEINWPLRTSVIQETPSGDVHLPSVKSS